MVILQGASKEIAGIERLLAHEQIQEDVDRGSSRLHVAQCAAVDEVASYLKRVGTKSAVTPGAGGNASSGIASVGRRYPES